MKCGFEKQIQEKYHQAVHITKSRKMGYKRAIGDFKEIIDEAREDFPEWKKRAILESLFIEDVEHWFKKWFGRYE